MTCHLVLTRISLPLCSSIAVAAHKALLDRVEACLGGDAAERRRSISERRTPTLGDFDRRQDEHRELLVAFLLHCADLCTPLMPPAQSQSAAQALAREFDAQAVRARRWMPAWCALAWCADVFFVPAMLRTTGAGASRGAARDGHASARRCVQGQVRARLYRRVWDTLLLQTRMHVQHVLTWDA